MAIRDRYTVKFRDGSPELRIEATKQGGSVEYAPPARGGDFYVFEELNAANPPQPIRKMEVHKDTIRAIVNDVAPKGKK